MTSNSRCYHIGGRANLCPRCQGVQAPPTPKLHDGLMMWVFRPTIPLQDVVISCTCPSPSCRFPGFDFQWDQGVRPEFRGYCALCTSEFIIPLEGTRNLLAKAILHQVPSVERTGESTLSVAFQCSQVR